MYLFCRDDGDEMSVTEACDKLCERFSAASSDILENGRGFEHRLDKCSVSCHASLEQPHRVSFNNRPLDISGKRRTAFWLSLSRISVDDRGR